MLLGLVPDLALDELTHASCKLYPLTHTYLSLSIVGLSSVTGEASCNLLAAYLQPVQGDGL